MMNLQSSKINNAVNYMASAMPSANHQNTNPIDTLSIEDIKYLQIYLEKLREKKVAQNKSQSNSNQTRSNCNQDPNSYTIPVSRANDMYNPLEKEVPVPIDWKAFSSNFSYPQFLNHNKGTQYASGNPSIDNHSVDWSAQQPNRTHFNQIVYQNSGHLQMNATQTSDIQVVVSSQVQISSQTSAFYSQSGNSTPNM